MEADKPNDDLRAPVPGAVDDARLRREQKQKDEEAARARDGAKPGTATYDPMSPPLGRMS
jgi:hypothetical protein